MLETFELDSLIAMALKEDIALGDITTDNLIEEESVLEAVYIAKSKGVIAGLEVAKRVFTFLDKDVEFVMKVKDGAYVEAGDIIAEIRGNTRVLLKGERVALNFLQHLSGIATNTHRICEKVKELPVRIVDTRKTIPGLRIMQKYAVRAGGGYNHRFCLSDGVLIKDNHIKAAGGIKKAIEKTRQGIPHTIKIEIETETLEQVQEALDSRADIIMLDNMTLDTMRQAVQMVNGKAITEASGNVNIDTVYDIAATGVNIISIGGLTHSVTAFDISMKII